MELVKRFACISTLVVCWATPLLGQGAFPSCNENRNFARLDFWVGRWEVFDEAGQPQGSNVIEKVLDGCAIFEHWTGSDGSQGKSVFYFDVNNDVWKQVWITQQATAPGGLKEKKLIETLESGAVRFQGSITLTDGRVLLDRTTLTPLPDGSVRQQIQLSQDDGKSWNEGWVGIYRPAR